MKISIKKLAEKIEADNEIFNNMSKAEKRVQIARDCLDRISLKQFEPLKGITCSIDMSNLDWDESIKDVINKQKLPECQACAKGGLFLSYVGRTNEFNFDSIQDSSNLESSEMKKLLEIFEPLQLNGIEASFEGSVVCDGQDTDSYDDDIAEIELFLEQCTDYQDNIKTYDSTEVLRSICKNIIKNKGEFVPTDHVSPNARIK